MGTDGLQQVMDKERRNYLIVAVAVPICVVVATFCNEVACFMPASLEGGRK